jgi:hypothetical protein
MMACAADSGQLPTEAGSWVTLHEYVGSPDRGELALPSGDRSDLSTIPDRPADFRAEEPFASCPVDGTGLTASFEELAFRDAGRVFVARIVTAYPSGDAPDLTEAQGVLNSLRISPLPTRPTETTAVAPTLPSVSTPTTTTGAPFVPTSDDEQQITDLFIAWQRNHPDDETRAMVEDADALLDTIHLGIGQHSEADLAKYSGRVESVQVTDPDHAVVVYTLLFDGVPQFGRRSGNAIRIDGVWKVSRETECALLALGGLSCPPRSNP